MSTCDLCEKDFSGPCFGFKWSDEWCLPCWFKMQDTTLEESGITPGEFPDIDATLRERTSLDEKLRTLRRELEDAEFECGTLRAKIDDLEDELEEQQDRCGALAQAIAALDPPSKPAPGRMLEAIAA